MHLHLKPLVLLLARRWRILPALFAGGDADFDLKFDFPLHDWGAMELALRQLEEGAHGMRIMRPPLI